MKQTIQTKEVIRGLGVHRHQIEQWVSRDYLRPTHEAKGRAGREWTFDDVFALGLLDTASKMDLRLNSVREVAHYGAPKIDGIPENSEDETFLLVSYGRLVRLLPDTRGLSSEETAEKNSKAPLIRSPINSEHWDFVTKRELLASLSGGNCKGAIVVPLTPLLALVQSLFEAEDEDRE